MNAIVTLVAETESGTPLVRTSEIGSFGDLGTALRVAKRTAGGRSKGESAGPRSFRFSGPLGTAYVGW